MSIRLVTRTITIACQTNTCAYAEEVNQRRKGIVRTHVLFQRDTETVRPRSPRLLLAPGAVRKRIAGRARSVDGAPARQLSSPAHCGAVFLQDGQRDEHRVNTVRAHA